MNLRCDFKDEPKHIDKAISSITRCDDAAVLCWYYHVIIYTRYGRTYRIRTIPNLIEIHDANYIYIEFEMHCIKIKFSKTRIISNILKGSNGTISI